MINSKKLLSIVCVFAIVVSMFSAMTVSAATVPAANLDIAFNKTESTKSSLVFDVTTDAEYMNTASIVFDITPIWTMISGTTFMQKQTTIANASSFGPAINANVNDTGATAKYAAMNTKKLKIQLACATSAAPFDFVNNDSNVIGKIVIPLTSELTEDITINLDVASTFLTPAVFDETSDTGFSFAEQYLSKEAMTATATSWAISFAAPPVDPEINTDNNAAVEDANDAKTWAVAVDADYAAAGDVLVATLTNSNFTGDEATQVVELTVGDDIEGGADWAFNLKVRFKDVAQRAATTLAIAKAN